MVHKLINIERQQKKIVRLKRYSNIAKYVANTRINDDNAECLKSFTIFTRRGDEQQTLCLQ